MALVCGEFPSGKEGRTQQQHVYSSVESSGKRVARVEELEGTGEVRSVREGGEKRRTERARGGNDRRKRSENDSRIVKQRQGGQEESCSQGARGDRGRTGK